MSQRGLIAAAALMVFATGFLLGRGCAPGTATPVPASPRTPQDAHSPDATRSADATARERTSSRRASAATNEVPVATPANDDSVPAAPGDEDFPFADVEVVWPDGSPAAGAIVYALPAGASQTGDDDPPQARCDTRGRSRLRVVTSGSYDVGGLLGTFQILATDVAFPAAAPVRLVLPEPCIVTVRMPGIEGQEPNKEIAPEHALRLEIESRERIAFPGRGETTRGCAEGHLRQSPGDLHLKAPRGVVCRIDHGPSYRVEPETFVAPAEVRVIAVQWYRVRVHIEPQPDDRRFAATSLLSARFSLEQGSSWTRSWTAEIPAGVPVGKDTTHFVMHDEFDRPAGTLRWQGEGLLSGSLTFSDLSADSQTTLTARLVLDPQKELPLADTNPAQPEAAPEASHTIRLAVDGVPGGDEIEVYSVALGGDHDDEWVARDRVWQTKVAHPRWALAAREEYVSPTVYLPDSPAEEVSLGLVRGGYLVVVPENVLPEGLGTALIERTDGRPFLFGDACVGLDCNLAVGARLGPFPPGSVEFKVTLAGRTLATARAVVRAGTHEVLRIPRLRAP